MKNRNWYFIDGMEQPNVDKIRTSGEKETYKYLGLLEAETITQQEMKERIKKEYFWSTSKLLDAKLYSRNLIKAIHTWAVTLVDIPDHSWSGQEKSVNKWTKEQEK